MAKDRRCCECRAGEHDDYDDDVVLAVVQCPESGHLVRRGFLCGEHRAAYRDDGYRVKESR